MLRVGITGGIGSGKSTVCAIFESLGIPVYYADAETKQLYTKNSGLKAAVINAFGPDVYLNGNLDRAKLAGIVFSNKEKLNQLNQIVHPFVIQDFEDWCKLQSQKQYVIKEAAIMFESGSYKQLDVIIGVVAPDDVRIERTMKRDGLSREEVIQRMNKQMPTDELVKRCHFIIENNGHESLILQVLNIHKQLLELSTKADSPKI